MVENLNSRLRNYFTLRRQLGGEYLSFLTLKVALIMACHATDPLRPASLHKCLRESGS
jgi:hypothetical protein